MHLLGDVAQFGPADLFAAAGFFELLGDERGTGAAGRAFAAGFGGKAFMVLPQGMHKAGFRREDEEAPVAEEDLDGVAVVELFEVFQGKVGLGIFLEPSVVVHDIVPDSVKKLRHRGLLFDW